MGDRFTRVGDRVDKEMRFIDLQQNVALSDSSLFVQGMRSIYVNGRVEEIPFEATLSPETEDLFPRIWVEPMGDITLPMDVEDPREDPVKGIEERLALDQGCAGEVVEAHQIGTVQPLREGLHQHHPLLHPDGHAFCPQAVEEIEKHLRLPSNPSVETASNPVLDRRRLLVVAGSEIAPAVGELPIGALVLRERLGVLFILEQGTEERNVTGNLLLRDSRTK